MVIRGKLIISERRLLALTKKAIYAFSIDIFATVFITLVHNFICTALTLRTIAGG